MTDKPRNKWFRGDGTLRKDENLAGCIVLCRNEASGISSVSARYGYWLTGNEYAIVPIDDLNLDIEEPEPELVQVRGCYEPTIVASSGDYFAHSWHKERSAICIFHPDKNVAIEAHNAAAEVLNKHGGVRCPRTRH